MNRVLKAFAYASVASALVGIGISMMIFIPAPKVFLLFIPYVVFIGVFVGVYMEHYSND